MMAMLKLNASPVLAKLGYKLLLQIHDEVILEGPLEHVEEVRHLFLYPVNSKM
jgi:DNA polymerase-1